MKRSSAIAMVSILGAPSCFAFSPLATRASITTAATARGDGLWMTAPKDPNDWFQTNHRIPVLDAEIDTSGQESSLSSSRTQKRQPMNPTPALVAAWQSLTDDKPQKPTAMLLGLALMLATTFATSNPAWAAMSGGRVGGGGYGRSMPSMSRPAPSRSYSSGGYYGGSTYGYSRPRTNVFINPSPTIIAPFGPPVISPFAPVVPFSPYGGAGVMVSRGPSIFDIMFFGAVALVIANTIRGFGQSAADRVMSQWSDADAPLGTGTTVAQISVALQVPNRDDPQSILNVLPRLSAAANTERRSGLQNLTSQIALELLRRKSQIVSASTKSQHFRDGTKAQQAFGQRAIQERSKFEKESFSRYRGRDWGDSSLSRAGDNVSGKATMAVVTLLVEIDGDSTKLPNINSMSNVEEALQKIASDSRVGECLQSAEILWTPEDRSESLTAREVAADYPELRNV